MARMDTTRWMEEEQSVWCWALSCSRWRSGQGADGSKHLGSPAHWVHRCPTREAGTCGGLPACHMTLRTRKQQRCENTQSRVSGGANRMETNHGRSEEATSA